MRDGLTRKNEKIRDQKFKLEALNACQAAIALAISSYFLNQLAEMPSYKSRQITSCRQNDC